MTSLLVSSSMLDPLKPAERHKLLSVALWPCRVASESTCPVPAVSSDPCPAPAASSDPLALPEPVLRVGKASEGAAPPMPSGASDVRGSNFDLDALLEAGPSASTGSIAQMTSLGLDFGFGDLTGLPPSQVLVTLGCSDSLGFYVDDRGANVEEGWAERRKRPGRGPAGSGRFRLSSASQLSVKERARLLLARERLFDASFVAHRTVFG